MAQSNPITIQGWQRGVGASPYVGFGKMVGMDIFRKPGIIQAGVRLDLSQLPSSLLTSIVTVEISDKQGNQYMGCSDGKFFKNGTLIHTASAAIHDMVIANDSLAGKDYLLISKADQTIDAYGDLNISPSYTADWVGGLQTSTNGYKKMLVGQDNVIYIANETKLASIVGFHFVSPSINTSALSTGIPESRVVQSICELNRYIVISTTVGNGTSGNTRLFFMDRGQTNGTGTGYYLSIGIDIPERKVNQLITQNNRLYFFGTDTGTVYTSNTTTYTQIAVIPSRLPSQSYVTYPNAVALLNNEILFGISGVFNSSYDTIYGVYSLRGNSLMTRNTISSGEYGQTSNVYIGSIYAYQNGTYNVTWQTGTSTYGIDIGAANIGTNYQCWFESPVYETGESIKPRTFQTAQFNFGNNLFAGCGLKLYYRQATNAPWAYYATYTFDGTNLNMSFWDGTTSSATVPSTQSGMNSFNSKFPVTLTTNVQIKVPFDTGNAPYGSNIELQSVILI